MLPPLCDANVHMMSIELNAAPTQRLFVSRYILRVIYAVTGIRSIKLAVFHHEKVSVPSKCVFSNTIQEIPNVTHGPIELMRTVIRLKLSYSVTV